MAEQNGTAGIGWNGGFAQPMTRLKNAFSSPEQLWHAV
jgi:hypothetical protein